MVSALSTPVDPKTNLTSASVWIPPGTWFPWQQNSTTALTGPQTYPYLSFGLLETPVFVKAGAVIPTQYQQTDATVIPGSFVPNPLVSGTLHFHVFFYFSCCLFVLA